MLGVFASARTKDHDIMDLSHCRNTSNLRLYDCMGSVYNTQGLSSVEPPYRPTSPWRPTSRAVRHCVTTKGERDRIYGRLWMGNTGMQLGQHPDTSSGERIGQNVVDCPNGFYGFPLHVRK